jgi:hypothetical protein
MESDPRKPVRALRDQAAEDARKLDLTSEEGQAAARGAVEILADLQQLDATRRAALASIALQVVALLALSALAVLCAGAILWILFHSDSPVALQIVSVPAIVSSFGTIVWAIVRRAEAERSSESPDRNGDAPERGDEDEDAPGGLLRWLRGRRR